MIYDLKITIIENDEKIELTYKVSLENNKCRYKVDGEDYWLKFSPTKLVSMSKMSEYVFMDKKITKGKITVSNCTFGFNINTKKYNYIKQEDNYFLELEYEMFDQGIITNREIYIEIKKKE